MLNCVYHPIDEMRVVEDEEYQRLLQTGVWFDHPNKAKEYKESIENELIEEEKAEPAKSKSKSVNKGQPAKKSRAKPTKEKLNDN